MTEQDVRDGLRGAVAGEPPLAFDPDVVVATAERQIRRRRALVATAVASTAVVVTAVALPALARQDSGGFADQPPAAAAGQPTSSSTQVEDIAWPPSDPGQKPKPYTVEGLQQRAEEMRAHLTATLASVLPSATDVVVRPFGGEAEGSINEGQRYLNAFAVFTMNGARLAVSVNVFAPGATTESPAETCAAVDCEVTGTVDGGPVVAKTDEHGGALLVSAYHYRPSGALVFVTAYNYDPTAGEPSTYLPDVPVAMDQLVALATDPALGL